MNLGWLAGFFDGEGCIYIQHNTARRVDRKGMHLRNSYQLQVTITQNDKEVLQEIQSVFRGQVYRHHGRRCYRWRACSLTALPFLIAIQPYVKIKKDQVDYAIKFLETIREHNLGSQRISDDIVAYRAKLANAIKLAKVGPLKTSETAGTPERTIRSQASQEEGSETIMEAPKGDGIVRHFEESEITDATVIKYHDPKLGKSE